MLAPRVPATNGGPPGRHRARAPRGRAADAGAGDRGETAGAFLERALGAVERYDGERLEDVLRRAALLLSALALVEEVTAPLLEELGERWSAGDVGPGQEHLASAVLERVLAWVRDGFAPADGASAPDTRKPRPKPGPSCQRSDAGARTQASTFLTFFAAGPRSFCTTSNSTSSPSSRDLNPGIWISEWWTKQSSSPSIVMNPKPLLSSNHFTVPFAMLLSSCVSHSCKEKSGAPHECLGSPASHFVRECRVTPVSR